MTSIRELRKRSADSLKRDAIASIAAAAWAEYTWRDSDRRKYLTIAGRMERVLRERGDTKEADAIAEARDATFEGPPVRFSLAPLTPAQA